MKADKIRAASRISRLDFKLWQEYLEIAQQFWLPRKLASKKRFLSLLFLLMAFMASGLMTCIAVTVKATYALAPDVVTKIAPGLIGWINGIVGSNLVFLLTAGLILPTAVFARYSRSLASFIKPWAILGILLLLSFTVSGLNVVISYVGRFFQTALSQKDQVTFWRFLFVYASVFIVGTPIVVIYGYIRKKLGLYWRESITGSFIDDYLKNRAYYELTSNRGIDNPDQRISEDLREFTVTSLNFLLIVLGALIDLIAFTGILWSISRLLSGILIVYALGGTLITILIGKRLVGLNFNQLRKEADFRYGLVHIRDNAESIAFYQGESGEKEKIRDRFKAVLRNYNFLIGWQRNLDFFTTGYNYLVVILPTLIVAPMYFAGKVEFGEISQAAFAFSQVLSAFSIIVQYFERISAFAAGINRVSTFQGKLSNAAGSKQMEGPGRQPKETIRRAKSDTVRLRNLTLMTPNYDRTLVQDLTLEIEEVNSLLIVGHSGAGKSSLLRGIAGLWSSGKGSVEHPPLEDVMFLPQKPYMVLGTFRDQLQYPSGRPLVEEEIEQVLLAVNLGEFYEKLKGSAPGSQALDIETNWEEVLSQGEQQRLAFARLLISKPRFAILDEATSALDTANEKHLYQALSRLNIRYISVGHRPSLANYHEQILKLHGNGKWSVHRASQFAF